MKWQSQLNAKVFTLYLLKTCTTFKTNYRLVFILNPPVTALLKLAVDVSFNLIEISIIVKYKILLPDTCVLLLISAYIF